MCREFLSKPINTMRMMLTSEIDTAILFKRL